MRSACTAWATSCSATTVACPRLYEGEQTRLARLAARTGLVASAWTALAVRRHLPHAGRTAVERGDGPVRRPAPPCIALRSGSSNLDALVMQVNYLHEEALFVADLDRSPPGSRPPRNPHRRRRVARRCRTASRWRSSPSPTPAGYTARPSRTSRCIIPTGKIIALVGENGSGKSTLVNSSPASTPRPRTYSMVRRRHDMRPPRPDQAARTAREGTPWAWCTRRSRPAVPTRVLPEAKRGLLARCSSRWLLVVPRSGRSPSALAQRPISRSKRA